MTSEIDEGPSEADLDRFGGDTGHCPACGAEVWDDAAACPACGAVIDGTISRPPAAAGRRRVWIVVIALAATAAFVLSILRIL